MATKSCRDQLWAEAICPICLKYFTDPVSLVCGHNFCRSCIALCWKGLAVDVTCPQCGGNGLPREVTPNWELAGLVRETKKLVAQAMEESRKKICEKHQKPLRFFCEDDQAPLCVVCDMSEAHGGHSLLPLGEFKGQIEGYLKILRNTRDDVMTFTLSDGISQQLLKWTEMEKARAIAQFQHLYHVVEEQQHRWLTAFVEIEEEIVRRRDERTQQILNRITLLGEVISELEAKYSSNESTFLEDFGNTPHRFEEESFGNPPASPSELEAKLQRFSDRKLLLDSLMKELNDQIVILKGRGKKRRMSDRRKEEKGNKVDVTLDPDTADPSLLLSDDLKSVCRIEPSREIPSNHEIFSHMPCVLGREAFISGKRWWEVRVEGKGPSWAVGVARESVSRKDLLRISPRDGIWAVGKHVYDPDFPCQLRAFTSPEPKHLILSRKPVRIGICLDYEEGCVAFFNVDREELIFAFRTTSFSGERICPFFHLSGAVRLSM